GLPALSATNSFRIIVREVNQKPVLPVITVQTAIVLAPFSLTVAATDADLPVQTLTRALVSGPAGLALTAAGGLSWTPTAAQLGTTNLVTVKVTDNGVPALSATNSFQIVVKSAAAAPSSDLPRLSITRSGATGTLILEVLATEGTQVVLEGTDDLHGWSEVERVTGLGSDTPVTVPIPPSSLLNNRLWRVTPAD
ncbi:MAG: hypothetical protein RIS76_4251, partial [Verrucomicrobiota bacterium]